ncbi:unnamed protein product, partial [Medioppia subpectinata]
MVPTMIKNCIKEFKKLKKRTDFIQLMIDSEKSDKDLGYDSISDAEQEEDKIYGEKPKSKPSGTLSPDEMVAQAILFYIAGYDTTSAALTHALYYLSEHKDCQQKLYEELRSCDEFTYEKLSQLKYLNGVIHETLRLRPSFAKLFRSCVQDYKLGNTGITIPAGTAVEINLTTLQRDPKYWPNAEEFQPERWFEPNHHPYAYLPFGAGPRLCIGQRFAINEMQMCLAKMIRKFEFTMVPGFEIEYFRGQPAMSPKELQYLRRYFTYWSRQGVPGKNGVDFSLIGKLTHEIDEQHFKEHGRIYGLYAFTYKVICINEPDLLRDILVKDFHIFPDHLNFHLGSSKLEQSLFFIPGNDDWKRQRSILSPVFTSGKLRSMLEHINQISDRFIHNLTKFEKQVCTAFIGPTYNLLWVYNDKCTTNSRIGYNRIPHIADSGPIDMRKQVGAFAMDVISCCAYGIDVESMTNPNHPIVLNASKILSSDPRPGIIVSALFPAFAKLIGAEPFDVDA